MLCAAPRRILIKRARTTSRVTKLITRLRERAVLLETWFAVTITSRSYRDTLNMTRVRDHAAACVALGVDAIRRVSLESGKRSSPQPEEKKIPRVRTCRHGVSAEGRL
jgi:hypothetical protein